MNQNGRNNRNNTGKDRQGKGSGRSNSNSGRGSTTETRKQTMEFTPHIAGKHQTVTYDTVKEHILQEIQKDLKNGSDLAVNLRNNNDIGIPINKPRRQIVKINSERGKKATEEEIADARIEQEGNDMEYTIDLKEWKSRQNTYNENKFKAYTLIYGYCNKTMQNRIEETTDFETIIRNDPFTILDTIKLKMYGQARAKYEFVQPTDTLQQFLSLKQDHGESLVEYTKRFKQSVDNLQAIFGKDFLNEYIEKTDEYKKSHDADDKLLLKNRRFQNGQPIYI